MLRLSLLRLRVFARRLWLGYSRDDLVLDVGSGHRPHPRSDVLCDRHLWDDGERLGPLVMDRPLVIGDLGALPFQDRSVGFLICQHVLEHVDDPAAALEEMMRVARAGYIETPTPLWERLVGRPYHRWLVAKEGSRLICTAKPEGIPDPELLRFFERYARSGSGWARLTLEHFDDFYTRFFWRDRIEYEVHGTQQDAAGAPQAAAHAAPPRGPEPSWRADGPIERLKPIVLRALRLLLAPRRHFDLDEIIACPVCRGRLLRSGGRYCCAPCRLEYPSRGGVPVLLRSEAMPLGPFAVGAETVQPEFVTHGGRP